MHKCVRSLVVFLSSLLLISLPARAQQTLGAINGTVSDSTGAVLSKVEVKIRNLDTNLEVTVSTKDDGSFLVNALPIGPYSVSFARDGFKTEVHNQITVTGGVTATVNASLQPGEVSTSITVSGTPLLNQTDTTNGYTLGTELIENTPLGTGSFTQLALLSPGVNADFLTGSGTNAGLGNQNIFANGQRDTSNSFVVNGVQTNNLFNGKSSSGVADNRSVLNTGQNTNGAPGGEIQTSTSVYSAIGQAMPAPPQETLEEVRVNTSMYDASEGSYSGAHITLQTRTGTNQYHGQAYEYHQTDAWNAAPFFFNQDQTLRNLGKTVPELKRNSFGATFGGPIKKDKLFFFAAYQGQRVSDEDSSISEANVLPGLSDSNRDAASLAALANSAFGTTLTAADISPTALKIMNLKLPNGQFFIPSENNLNSDLGYNALTFGPKTTFKADQVSGNIDYNLNGRDRLTGKYYYQNDPTFAPFAISQVGNFPQELSAGSHLLSIQNTTTVSPNAVWTQGFGFIREKAFAHTIDGYTNGDYGLNIFGLSNVPGISIGTANPNTGSGLGIGPSNNFANAGMFQNTFEGSTKYSWTVGRHTIVGGVQVDHSQLNIINKNGNQGLLDFDTFADFLQGNLCNPTVFCGENGSSVFVSGETNRYYRSNQVGAFGQDTFRLKSNLTVIAGLRWDWNGPLVEKNGLLTNFYPKDYSYDFGTDTISNIGIVVAGNNKEFPTKGVSDSTLTGRQWGFAPRIGVAWTPGFLHNVVVRAGFGMYYDRGEYFAELSQSAGGGIGGPFGVTVQQPFSVPFYSQPGNTFATPFGTTPPPAPPKNLSGVASLIPNIAQLIDNTTPYCTANGISFCSPLIFAGYDPTNKLPYSENYTLNSAMAAAQRPRALARVRRQSRRPRSHPGAVQPAQHRHAVEPHQRPDLFLRLHRSRRRRRKRFDACGRLRQRQHRAPRPLHRLRSQLAIRQSRRPIQLRRPAIQRHQALQPRPHALRLLHLVAQHGRGKRRATLLQRRQPGKSAHRLRQFGLRSPSRLHDSVHLRISEARDVSRLGRQNRQRMGHQRPHLCRKRPALQRHRLQRRCRQPVLRRRQRLHHQPARSYRRHWQHTRRESCLAGHARRQSRQLPFSTARRFGIPLLQPGQNGVPPCDPVSKVCDVYETNFGPASRNIFVSPFQSRVDMGVFKNFKINERFNLKFDVQAFNIFNHPSFDTPNNNVEFNPFFENPPQYGAPFPVNGQTNCAAPDAYVCPPSGKLGLIQHTIGSPRFLQMALHLTF